jgi:hypothetical protein
MANTQTTIVAINIVLITTTRRHFNLRCCFLSTFFFSSMTRVPSLQFSLLGSTLTSGVPSTRQNADEPSA